MKILNSYLFNENLFTENEKHIFNSLPEDFRNFLQKNNGGEVEEGDNWFDYFADRKIDATTIPSNNDGVRDFWGFISYENQKELEDKTESILHQHFDLHIEEDFLPDGILIFANCVSGSLLGISINKEDYGVIYYWNYYWHYPWYEEFYHNRVKDAESNFDNIGSIMVNEEHPEHQKACDALNYATLVKVADNFTDFLNGLYQPEDD